MEPPVSDPRDSILVRILEEIGALRDDVQGIDLKQTVCNSKIEDLRTDTGQISKELGEVTATLQGPMQEPGLGLVQQVKELQRSERAREKRSARARNFAIGGLAAGLASLIDSLIDAIKGQWN